MKRKQFLIERRSRRLVVLRKLRLNCRCAGIDRNQTLIENPYRIPSAVVPLLEFIEALQDQTGPLVLAPNAISWMVPTYCRHARMVAARPEYIDYIFGFSSHRDELERRKRLLQYLVTFPTDFQQFKVDLDVMNVNVVILEKARGDIISAFHQLGFRESIVSGNYVLLTKQ